MPSSESGVEYAIDKNLAFARVPLATKADVSSVIRVPIRIDGDVVPWVAYRELWVRDKQQFCPPELIPGIIRARILDLPLSLDSEVKLSRFRTLPNSVLIEHPAQVLWTDTYNG